MIDLHLHILPGIDDGARSFDESLSMARTAVESGITVVAATPHVRDDYPTEAGTMERLVGELRDALAAEGLPLEVRPGGEVAVEWLERLSDDEIARFGLGGSPRHLLVECPYGGWPLDLGDRLFELRLRGFTPVLAHPERNDEVQRSPEVLRPVVEAGAFVQITAASIDGRLGRRAWKTASRLLDLGLAHLLASDAHSPDVRGGGFAAAVRRIDNDALAAWLTREVPEAILAGEAAPPGRPGVRRRRLAGSLRRRAT